MKILIIDAYHDSDRGGVGILAGILNTIFSIGKDLDEKMDVGVVYRFSEDDNKFNSVARHTNKAFPNIEIFGAPIRTFRKYSGFLGDIEALLIFVYSLLKVCFPFLFSDKVIKAINDADIVISKGGHFYKSRTYNPIMGFYYMSVDLYTLILTMRLKKKYAIVAHTVGPFNNYTSRLITRFVFRNAVLISTREDISKSILLDLGCNDSEVQVLPDTAFALMPAHQASIETFLEKIGLTKNCVYATFTARFWSFPGVGQNESEKLYKKYLITLANIADFLIDEELVDKVLLVVHNDGKHSEYENDSKPITTIFNEMDQKDDAIIIDQDISPEMLSTLYGKSKLMIGTRLHAVIFALIGGAPAIAISYNHKVDGIMGMIGLQEYVLDISNMDISKAKTMIYKIFSDEERVMQLANKRIQEFRLILKNTLRELLAS